MLATLTVFSLYLGTTSHTVGTNSTVLSIGGMLNCELNIIQFSYAYTCTCSYLVTSQSVATGSSAVPNGMLYCLYLQHAI